MKKVCQRLGFLLSRLKEKIALSTLMLQFRN